MMGRKKKKPDDPLSALRYRGPAGDVKDTVLEHEEAAAASFGGKRHRGSGASPFLKSDASSKRFQIECKQTVNASISLKLDWLKKITREAIGRARVPALHIRFVREIEPDVERDWVALPISEVERLLEAAGEL